MTEKRGHTPCVRRLGIHLLEFKPWVTLQCLSLSLFMEDHLNSEMLIAQGLDSVSVTPGMDSTICA